MSRSSIFVDHQSLWVSVFAQTANAPNNRGPHFH
jgi:hypothetical protein